MNKARIIERTLIIGVLLLLGACTGEQHAEKVDEFVPTPDQYSALTLETAPRDGFCSDFGSPELASLTQRALDRNLNLRGAWARLEQVEAIQTQADSSLYPTVSVEASAQRGSNPTPVGGSAVSNSYRMSLPVAYELDLFGRLSAQRSAAELDTLAARADVESFAITISAQVAETWFNVVSQRQKINVIKEQIETSEKFLKLTKLRLGKGVANALDVTQQQQEIYRLNGQLELATAQEEIGRYQLAVLLGESPKSEVMGSTDVLPEIPAFPELGVPADLLEQRPDVRSALLRLKASDERTIAATRNLLPKIRLSASLFLTASDIGNLFDELFWSIAGAVSQPIFEGGRRHAEITRSEAAGKERLYAYAQTVLTAFSEVESAIATETRQEKYIVELDKQIEVAEVALRLSRDRYRAGAMSYLRVLTSLRSLQTLQQVVVDARRAQLSARLQTCRALGGDWTQSLAAPMDGEES